MVRCRPDLNSMKYVRVVMTSIPGRDMDANGVLSSMCFPSFPQFCGQLFSRAKDKEAALAIVQAYNAGISTAGVERIQTDSFRSPFRRFGART